jgi:hypothetical protein
MEPDFPLRGFGFKIRCGVVDRESHDFPPWVAPPGGTRHWLGEEVPAPDGAGPVYNGKREQK